MEQYHMPIEEQQAGGAIALELPLQVEAVVRLADHFLYRVVHRHWPVHHL
jgi:hypothetical protein